MNVSIFNDVIGPVMRGPSSSHCAAALRIGRMARDLMGGPIDEVLVEFDRQGSLPSTHESQGSDMGLFGGLLGWEAVDPRLPDAAEAIRASGIALRFEAIDAGDPHPNTYRLSLHSVKERHSLIAVSTGGGMIEVTQIDGFPLSMAGDCHETLIRLDKSGDEAATLLRGLFAADDLILHRSKDGFLLEVKAREFVGEDVVAQLAAALPIRWTKRLHPVLPVLSRKGAQVPFSTCEELLRYDAGRNMPLWKLAVAYETALGDLTEEQVLAKMIEIVRILRRSIAQGIAGTSYDDRLLGHQSGKFQQCMAKGALLGGDAINRTTLYVTALMEVKSSMGVIVAAPTAGACAALPGAVIAAGESQQASEEDLAKAMLAAGVIGAMIAARWTFAAEAGGCQAECGSAACMAAAALVSLAGGTLRQSLAAASMALQNMLGLACDPVANRVEAPCLGKNVLAAGNALCSANMALSDFDPLIPLDEVIDAAKRIGDQMPREVRCTAMGGLSITPTSLALERQLAARKTNR